MKVIYLSLIKESKQVSVSTKLSSHVIKRCSINKNSEYSIKKE